MAEVRDLSGKWHIELDPKNEGIRNKWFARTFKRTIALPGTTDEAKLGEWTGEQCADRLSRVYRWIGPAWYQRAIVVPHQWKNKRIILFLERTKDSQVWVDNTWIGRDDSLSTPHEYDLSKVLTPGKHQLTVLVDNAKLPPVGPCHQVDERTQTNWNGIVGRIELQVGEPVWIQTLRTYPDPEHRCIRVEADVVNDTRWSGLGNFVFSAEVIGRKRAAVIKPVRVGALLGFGATKQKATLVLPADVPSWDEFDTALIRVNVTVEAMPVATLIRESLSTVCGLRALGTRRGQLILNGRPLFLRGKNDCALFPLTGYAPMEKAEWVRLLSIAKAYGINHYRFHSWCPPEAAFAAADEVGIYFQVELPNKREITAPGNEAYRPPAEAYETLDELIGGVAPAEVRTGYLTREGERILRSYGNHPSFFMLTLGNELGGDEAVMNRLCERFRALDNRHLYARGTGAFHWDIKYRPGDDFWVTRATAPGLEVRGASWGGNNHIDNRVPSTDFSYQAAVQGVPVPVIGHENAQFEVFPDFREIRKYTGVLKAHCFEIFRERLRKAGMLDQALDFLRASGAISVICHREDVEAALRTAGFGGFQLLDLQDFSGQGVALVGMLDVFMDSKGLITPRAWREFCCETVPLLRMRKFTWTTGEVIRGRICVAHYGPRNLAQVSLAWEIRAGTRTVARGVTDPVDIPTGTVTDVDILAADLATVKAPEKLRITIRIPETPYRNSYDAWVYPVAVNTVVPEDVVYTRTFDRKTAAALNAGKKVLLIPKPGTLKRTVAMAFPSGFWSPMFRKGDLIGPDGKETPGTQGILCDPKHPVFKAFPTEFHTNWQWWQLVKHCDPMILDETDRRMRPTVQVIDGFDRNHKLGLVVEARVGKGRLLICTIDLPGLQSHPEARQLQASMHGYMVSPSFNPVHALTADEIRNILR